MTRGEELAVALARWIHLARPSIVSLDFNDVAEISEAKQAIIAAIDGPEGYVMVAVPIPPKSKWYKCCFQSGTGSCNYPTPKPIPYCLGDDSGVPPDWCPLKEA